MVADTWPSEIINLPPAIKTTVALFNIYPTVIACLLWGNKWCCKNISFLCDDKSTVNILKSRSDNPFINCLIRRLTWICVNNFILKAAFLPHINNKADTLSHFKFQEFHAHCPEAHPTSLLHPCSAKLSQIKFTLSSVYLCRVEGSTSLSSCSSMSLCSFAEASYTCSAAAAMQQIQSAKTKPMQIS